MGAENTCRTCQSEISGDGVDGLCPKCLGRLAFLADDEGAEPARLLRLGDYELLEEIARGGMGVVYRARQLSLNRIVALKVVLHGPFSSRDFVARFRQEAQAVAALRHPNIVAIHDVGEHDGSHFIALEFVDGGNFAELVRERPLPARRAAHYLRIIAQAVEHAHERGVLHRDLKPSNILLDVFDQPRITDFGLAKVATQDFELTVTGQVLGSPNYMAPEQAAGKFSDSAPASDVYSLGAILYELLTARPPFQGETLQAILGQVQNAEPLPPVRLNPDVPVDLQTICLKCLQKDPARRYASARELVAEDLGCFLDGKPIRARPVQALERAWLWCRRRPVLAALASALVATVVLGVGGIVWQWRVAEFHAEGELKQRLIAEQDDAASRLNLYAADISVAAQQVENGHPGLARATLARLRPAPGTPDLRGFEWRYLWHLSRGDQLVTLKGHTNIVGCAAFSPDGTRLATGGHDGQVRIWNPVTGGLVTSLTVSTSAVWSVGFTPDARRMVIGCNENVQVWDAASWRKLTNYPGELAVLSPAGTLLATAESSPFFFEPAGPVRIWDWSNGRLVAQFDPGRALAWSPDGRLLAVAGVKTGLIVYNIASQKAACQWPTSDSIWSLHFSPDSRHLLATDWSKDVSVWSVADSTPPRLITGHQLHVWSAVYSPDGSTIATVSSDQTVRLWDAATLAPRVVLHGHSSEVWCVTFSPDGRTLATGSKDQTVMLWPTAVAARQNEVPNEFHSTPLFSPNGQWLVTVNPGTMKSMLWSAEDLSLASSNVAAGRSVVGFSRDSRELAAFDSGRGQLEFWRPTGTEPVKRVLLAGAGTSAIPAVFAGCSPGQERFFAIDAAGLIRVWDADSGRLVSTIQGPAPPIRNAVLSLHGTQIAVSVELENAARLYDCATGAEHVLGGHRDFVSGLAFSPDGSALATGSMDGTIRLWNTTNGDCTGLLAGHLQESTDVAFSPDGRTLGSVGRRESLKLWHLPTLREVYSEAVPDAGQWLRFSPNGRRLAVGIETGKVRLLDSPPD